MMNGVRNWIMKRLIINSKQTFSSTYSLLRTAVCSLICKLCIYNLHTSFEDRRIGLNESRRENRSLGFIECVTNEGPGREQMTCLVWKIQVGFNEGTI